MDQYKRERWEKTRAEQKRGMHASAVNMCNGLVELLKGEFDPNNEFKVVLVSPVEADFRKWSVQVYHGGDLMAEELFMDFPSDTLKATIMLLRR